MCNGPVVGKSLVVEFEELRVNQVAGAFLAGERATKDQNGRKIKKVKETIEKTNETKSWFSE